MGKTVYMEISLLYVAITVWVELRVRGPLKRAKPRSEQLVGGVRSCCQDCNRTSSKNRFSLERKPVRSLCSTKGVLTLQGKLCKSDLGEEAASEKPRERSRRLQRRQ